MERHKKSVSLISSTIKSFFDRSEPYRIFHGSTNSTRPAHLKKAARLVDISSLRNVLKVDKAKRTALVEPNVPMDRLVEATLPHGLIPPVVMEFPGITAGGGFAGTAGESSSFRWGYFDETVKGVEMVLPDGQVVNAANPGHPDASELAAVNAKGQYADLFKGAAGSVGTLGVTTLLELQLIEAKRYVRTTYRRTTSVAEAIRVVKEECAKPENDYVDGILFSKTHGVIVSGTLTDEPPAPGQKPQTFSAAWDPWFYLHVQDVTKSLPSSSASASTSSATALTTGRVTEHIPLAEYLFRYDRGGFWVGAAAFDYFRPVPFTRFFRWFLDDFLHTRMLYRALHDLALPYETAEAFVDYVDDSLGIWPLWLCPLKTPAGPTFHPHLRRDGTHQQKEATQPSSSPAYGEMLNIGVWGWGPSDRAAFVSANRSLESKLQELGGMKWLYAHTYYERSEFWGESGAYGPIRAWYEALRSKYQATAANLPDVYDKVRVKDAPEEGGWKGAVKKTWPLGGLVGIARSIQSGDYWLHRKATWKWQNGGEQKEEEQKQKTL
ncbi:FAD binding domain-containing protein [Apiospora rasikravindrae]|uniref:Delta(24)-sterol reductase n=1 Tax=Apiospora rasikravindrae TaxID=990691 RepID=A0ABR1TH42_9PEZI